MRRRSSSLLLAPTLIKLIECFGEAAQPTDMSRIRQGELFAVDVNGEADATGPPVEEQLRPEVPKPGGREYFPRSTPSPLAPIGRFAQISRDDIHIGAGTAVAEATEPERLTQLIRVFVENRIDNCGVRFAPPVPPGESLSIPSEGVA
jgi:hypothetical protein